MKTNPRSLKPVVAPWVPDAGDGTYRNPVLYADYSDPDVIRVGEDYWMTSSSFGHVPGLPILHSHDTVNWTIVNHALPRLVPDDHFSTPRHGQGVWAPSIRHHRGKFWIYFPDPDFGLYVVTADDPRGHWSSPVMVKAGKGLIDPCPFWDIDGQGYLIHGWAKSRSGIKNRLTLHRLSTDGFSVADEGVVVIDGDQMPGWNTIEGPKLYQRGDYYYIFAPAGGVGEGYQAVFRSKSLYGPFENRIVLAQGSTPINGPHQGAWVTTPEGHDAFFHFQEMPVYGRVVHLQPMTWRDDWPLMGNPSDAKLPGEPVLTGKLLGPPSDEPEVPATSDDFDGPTLGLQWQWQANPQDGWYSFRECPPRLRLHCVRRSTETTLWTAGNLLLQKFAAPSFRVTTRLELSPSSEGDCAGLVVFGFSYAWLGLVLGAAGTDIVLAVCHNAHEGGRELISLRLPVQTRSISLRVDVAPGGTCRFAYSETGTSFVDIGEPFPARSSYWVGAKVGVFASGISSVATAGYADFHGFHVSPPSP